MSVAYFHGEGILFSGLVHGLFFLSVGAALLFGLLKYSSKPGAYIAIAYIAVTLICNLLALNTGSVILAGATNLLTLPWNLVLPCYGLDRSCPLSPVVAFLSAELNAAVLYFLVAFVSSVKDN